MLHRSMAYDTTQAHDHVCRLDRSGSVPRALPHRRQVSATTLLCDVEQQRDVSRALAGRASIVLGQTSRHRNTQLPAIRCASRATRPGLAVGLIQVTCNGLCTARRCHVDVDEDDQFLQVGLCSATQVSRAKLAVA